MDFKAITIRNFRNFKKISIDLSNNNIFFGLNDVGKTNFLFALRYVFDKDIRKQNLLESDFHNKDITKPIEIVVTIDISDENCTDCQKLRAKLKGALLSEHEFVYIKLIADYQKKESVATPILYWGGDLENLIEMKQTGYLYDIDRVFNVLYIDSYVDLYTLFKKNVNMLIKNEDEDDNDVLGNIGETVKTLNGYISSLSGIKKFEDTITPKYHKFKKENVSISIKSEIAVKGLYSNIIPYIKHEGDDNIYPTSGDGRRKILAYSIFDMLSDETADVKINLFLIEEPENHLHKAMQIALSQVLFSDDIYKYLFVSTHSPFILYGMDEVNLVRIYNETKINSASYLYKVPQEYKTNRLILNRTLSEAIFADRVLLVEGPSELQLFQKVLTVKNPLYEAEGGYVLDVGGIGFRPYFEILDALHIKDIVKTDNDLRKRDDGLFSVLGFIRCNNFMNNKQLPLSPIPSSSISARRKLYRENIRILDDIRNNYNIFLSKVDLENDLDEVLHEELVKYLKTDKPVKYLQEAKHYHMVELVKSISDNDCMKIYEHYNFAYLKEVLL